MVSSQVCQSPVIIALDYADISKAKALVSQLSPENCRVKVGKEMFTLYGPEWVSYLVASGFEVFLDLKFHDIPNTVAKAVSAASQLGVWMVNVHASGGDKMISAAKQAAQEGRHKPLLTAVTILTSMDEAQFSQVYEQQSIASKVKSLALLAEASGADGVVCSAKEASMLRECVSTNFALVTPGIRPADASLDDQKRVMTPTQAIKEGVNYLVIGRPITQANDPTEALRLINLELGCC